MQPNFVMIFIRHKPTFEFANLNAYGRMQGKKVYKVSIAASFIDKEQNLYAG